MDKFVLTVSHVDRTMDWSGPVFTKTDQTSEKSAEDQIRIKKNCSAEHWPKSIFTKKDWMSQINLKKKLT